MAGALPKVGSYELVRELGRGTTGVVYLGRKPGSEEHVAIKVLLETDANGIARFNREVELARQVRHPGIVTIHSTGVAQGRHFLVMEHIAGETLAARLERGPLEVAEAMKLVRALADAVAAAHEKGVIHRDLKPANVLVAASGPKIVDFGLGRDLRERARLTQTGSVLGTPAYMSPEQLEGRKEVDARADVYALGVILYECLHGKHPYPARTIKELLELIAVAGISFDDKLPPGLVALVQRAMARDLAARTASAAALRGELDRALAETAAAPRRPVALVAVALLLVLGGGVAAGIHGVRSDPPGPALPVSPPPPAPPPDREEVRTQLERARSELRTNHLARAAADAAAVLAMNDASPAARSAALLVVGIARTREGPGSAVEATKAFEDLARVDDAGARGELARAYLELLADHRESAEARARASLAREPLEETLVLLGELYASAYNPLVFPARRALEIRDLVERARADACARRALDEAERAVTLCPEDAFALRARAEVRLVTLLRGSAVPVFEISSGAEGCVAELRKVEALDGPDARDPYAALLLARTLVLSNDDAGAQVALGPLLATGDAPVEAQLLEALLANRAHADYSGPVAEARKGGIRRSHGIARFLQWLPAGTPLLGDLRELERGFETEKRHELRERQVARLNVRIAGVPKDAADALETVFRHDQEATPLRDMEKDLERAIALATDDLRVAREVARIRMWRDDLHGALRLIARDDSREGLLLRGEVLLRLESADARATLARAATAIREPDPLSWLARSFEARARGASHEARDLAERACIAAPDVAETHAALAAALLVGEGVELDAAEAEAERALLLGGWYDAEAMYSKALARVLITRVFQQLNDPDTRDTEGRKTLHQLEEMVPNSRFPGLLEKRLSSQ
jgi:predicted Ser/Thr protein kinase